jgi:hypothetical protein
MKRVDLAMGFAELNARRATALDIEELAWLGREAKRKLHAVKDHYPTGQLAFAQKVSALRECLRND